MSTNLEINQLNQQLEFLQNNPPWKNSSRVAPITEGVGAPYPGEYQVWQAQIKALQNEIDSLLQINRP